MSETKKVRRQWAVYCEDGELWVGGFRSKDTAQIELAYANAECDHCDSSHTLALETETGAVLPVAKTA